MPYYSTKKQSPDVALQEALFRGLPPDNGLYMPRVIPELPAAFFDRLSQLSLAEIGFEVSKALLGGEVPEAALQTMVSEALNFPTPVVRLNSNTAVLELFHGPTLAFKDVGARFMARLMRHFSEDQDQELHILVATSGDTGSAVAQGFLGVEGIKVTILYPKGKVSKIQEQQLTTNGHNITALEVEGSFDDCQRMVKEAFLDQELQQKLRLTSANSINISRLIPQSFYYFYAAGQVGWEEPLTFITPSGNFGNICGGLLAQKMGLPISHFIAATNANAVFPHYIETGEYMPQPSVPTLANAMDVGAPSNFARIQELFGESHQAITSQISSRSVGDSIIKEVIARVQEQYHYTVCPHTATGVYAWEKAGRAGQGVVLATAHPCKFGDVVEPIIGQPVAVPERLQAIVNREKQAIPMRADFKELKGYLL